VIYIDSSVALARLLFEPRAPSAPFWQEQLVSSRLLEYEIWNRVRAYALISSHGQLTNALLMGIALLEMDKRVLARALEPWPIAIRTLDGLHLATAEYLRSQGCSLELASYDNRLIAAARAIGVPIAVL
jgi:PIN domain